MKRLTDWASFTLQCCKLVGYIDRGVLNNWIGSDNWQKVENFLFTYHLFIEYFYIIEQLKYTQAPLGQRRMYKIAFIQWSWFYKIAFAVNSSNFLNKNSETFEKIENNEQGITKVKLNKYLKITTWKQSAFYWTFLDKMIWGLCGAQTVVVRHDTRKFKLFQILPLQKCSNSKTFEIHQQAEQVLGYMCITLKRKKKGEAEQRLRNFPWCSYI